LGIIVRERVNSWYKPGTMSHQDHPIFSLIEVIYFIVGILENKEWPNE
jgi:hypothetical protein